MNRDELDAFFAKAEDVLTNWHGSPDAMHGGPERTARNCVEMSTRDGGPWRDHVQIQGGSFVGDWWVESMTYFDFTNAPEAGTVRFEPAAAIDGSVIYLIVGEPIHAVEP